MQLLIYSRSDSSLFAYIPLKRSKNWRPVSAPNGCLSRSKYKGENGFLYIGTISIERKEEERAVALDF